MLGGNRGGGNVVVWRDLPTGKGERPSSHTPEPEDVNRGRGRSPGIRPGKNPANEDPHDPSPFPFGMERDLPSAGLRPSTGGSGEIEMDSKGFRPTATTEEGTQGRTRPTLTRRQGNRSRRTSHPQIRSWCATYLGHEGVVAGTGKADPAKLRVCYYGVTWLILPVVICLSQRLSHACLSISDLIQRNCEWLIKSVIVYLIVSSYMDNRSKSRANTC